MIFLVIFALIQIYLMDPFYDTSMNSCVACRVDLPEMAKFCPTCGFSQSQDLMSSSKDSSEQCIHVQRFRQKSGGMFCPTCQSYIDESSGALLNLWEPPSNKTESKETDIFVELFGGVKSKGKSSDSDASESEIVQQKFDLVGNQIWKKVIFGKKIAIYEKSFITISPVFFSLEEDPERLISISVEFNSQKKSPIGRGAAAMATGGWNLLLASNRKGDIFVTVSTDVEIHVFHAAAPGPGIIKSCLELEAVVNRAISNG